MTHDGRPEVTRTEAVLTYFALLQDSALAHVCVGIEWSFRWIVTYPRESTNMSMKIPTTSSVS